MLELYNWFLLTSTSVKHDTDYCTFDIYPALSVAVEEILVISKIGLVRREDRDVPGVEVMIVSRCGVTIKACFLGGLYPSLFAKRLCT